MMTPSKNKRVRQRRGATGIAAAPGGVIKGLADVRRADVHEFLALDGPAGRTLYRDDIHPNALGQEVIATVMLQAIGELKLWGAD